MLYNFGFICMCNVWTLLVIEVTRLLPDTVNVFC